jgi:hypothetical protein
MTSVARAVLLASTVAVGLSVIPLTAIAGSFLATHAVATVVRKSDLLTLVVAPQQTLDRVAVRIAIATATR